MKLIVYVLSALLLVYCASADETTPTQDDVEDALKYGINWIFEQAAKDRGISNLNIHVTQVNSVDTWEDNGDTYYSFDVDAENDDASITSTFTVKDDSNGNLSVVDKWNYDINGQDEDNSNGETEVETADADTNVELDVEIDVEEEHEEEEEEEEVEEEEEEDHVEEDKNDNKCDQGDEVDTSEVDTNSDLKDALTYGVNWIYQQASDKYGISNSDVEVTGVNRICKWEDDGNTYYSFDVQADNNDAAVSTTYKVKHDNEGNLRVVNKWSYNLDNKSNNEENHDEGDADTEENEDKCKDIDISDIENDSNLKDALVHGISWIFQKAHDKFEISNEDIVVTKINTLCGWEEDGNNYYSFVLEAHNKDEDIVETSYNVKRESDGDLRVVNEWRYVIHYSDNTESENENCEDEGEYTNEELEQEVEIDVEITISNCQQGDEVDISELNSNSALKNALSYGVSWIFQNAAHKYGVSDSNLEVNQINNICKWEDNGDTYYSFDIEAHNDNNEAKVDATFNVKSDGNEELSVVDKWKYHIDYKTNDEEQSDHDDSTEEQETFVYEDNEEDVEINVEVNVIDNSNDNL